MRPAVPVALAAAALALVPAAAASGATFAGPSVAVVAPDPYRVVVEPRVLLAGSTRTVQVRAVAPYDEYEEVTVQLAGAALTPDLEQVEEDLDGSLYTGDVEVPDDPPCGLQDLTVTWHPYEGDDITRTTPVYVLCPSLTITPGSVDSGSLPRVVRWEMSGFVPSSAVALRIDGEPVEVVRTDPTGRARYSGPVDDLDCGTVDVEAIDQFSSDDRKQYGVPQDLPIAAGTTLTVRCPSGDDPVDPVDPVVPSVLLVNPAVVAAGTTTRATGSLFPAGSTAELVWLMQDGTTQPAATVDVADDGTFAVDVLVLVNSRQGSRELVAASGAAVASDQALVVAGTTQPGRHGLVSRR